MNQLIALACWIFAIWLIRKDTAGEADGIFRYLDSHSLGRHSSVETAHDVGGVWWRRGHDGGQPGRPAVLLRDHPSGVGYLVQAERQLVAADFAKLADLPLLRVFARQRSLGRITVRHRSRDGSRILGNVFVAGVILTEVNPLQAIRAVFVRCAYLLLSIVNCLHSLFSEPGSFLRQPWRRWTVIGVTTQKNSLGALVLICGLMLLWDWFERYPLKKFYHRQAGTVFGGGNAADGGLLALLI